MFPVYDFKESDTSDTSDDTLYIIKRVKRLLITINSIYHSSWVGYYCNKFGSVILTNTDTDPETEHIEGDIYYTKVHQYLFDALIGVKLHILNYFSDKIILYYSKHTKKFDEIYIQIHKYLRFALLDYGNAAGIVSAQCI